MITTPAGGLACQPLVSPRRPDARPIDLETLYHAHIISSCRWAADGRHIYFKSNVTGRFNIWRVPAEGGWPEQVTVSDERTALLDPSPDGRWVLYSQDHGGNEKPNLFLVPSPGGRPLDLTRTEGIGYHGVQWSPDGKYLAFAAEREAPGAYGVYLLEVATGAVEKVADHAPGQCLVLRWSPDGKKLALSRTHDFLHTGVSVLDLATGQERVLVPIDDETHSVVAGWTPDSQRIIINSDANHRQTLAIGLVGCEDGSLEWTVLDDWETATLDVTGVGGRFAYVRNEGGNHRLIIRDLRGQETQVGPSGGVVSMARFSPDGQRLAILRSAADSPNEVWQYDLPSGTLTQVSGSLVGGVTAADLVHPQLVVYPSFDGTPIAAFVYLPPNAQPDHTHPAIVYPHGGPTSQFTNGWHPNIQYLVSHGFVVIAPNYRGSTGFGNAFRESNRRDLGGSDLRDVVAAADFLKGTGYVDPHRIAIMGASYGGYLTLMALTRYPRLWAAGIAIVPFANWFTEYENEDPILQAYDRSIMGDPVSDAQLWRDRSPIFFVDQVRAPLLLLAGANDIRCPAQETLQMAESIQKIGGVVEVKVYENEGHGFSRRENWIDAFRRTTDFLRRHLYAGAGTEG